MARELFEAARKLFVEGRHQESIDVFSEFLTMRGNTSVVLLSRGVAYLKTGQIDKAIEDFGSVIGMDSQHARAYFYRGTARMSRDEFEKAIIDFDKTIEIKPDYGAAYFARGSAYAQTGNAYEAARNIKTAITFSEGNSQGFSDTFGMVRTQFNKAMALMEGKEESRGMLLTEEEIRLVKKWLEERDN